MTHKQRYNELRKQVAERIQGILDAKGWTLSHFATLLGKSKSHVSLILHGKANLTLRVIAELEKTLGESVVLIEPKFSKK